MSVGYQHNSEDTLITHRDFLQSIRINAKDCDILFVETDIIKKSILPSLSFRIIKTKNACQYLKFKNLSEIADSLKYTKLKKAPRTTDKFVNKIPKNYKKKHYKDQGLIVIYLKEKIKIDKKLIEKLYSFKKSSLNMLNNRYRDMISELETIRSLFVDSSKQTLINFTQYLRQYHPKTYLYNLEGENNWISSETNKYDLNDISHIISIGNPIYKSHNGEKLLILPFTNDQRKTYLNYLVLIASNDNIKTYLVDLFLKFSNIYLNTFKEKAKNLLIDGLSKEIISSQNFRNSFDEDFNIRTGFNSLLRKYFRKSLELTNSLSCSYRIYNPTEKSLILKLKENNKELQKKTIRHRRSIDVHDIKEIDALCFVSNKKYIHKSAANITNINYKSEISINFTFKEIDIGVINFKSGSPQDFDNSTIEFLIEIVRLLELYYISLFEVNDKNWLARRSQIYQNYHEIENTIRSSKFPKKYRDELLLLIEKQHISLDSKFGYLTDLNLERAEFITLLEMYLPEETIINVTKNCRININKHFDEYLVSQYFIDSVRIIYINLLTNYRKFADKERDILNFVVEKDKILITMKCSRPFDEQFLNKYFVRPYSTEDERPHFGLFIIGMLARHLQGYAKLDSSQDGFSSLITIRIPISNKWKIKQNKTKAGYKLR